MAGENIPPDRPAQSEIAGSGEIYPLYFAGDVTPTGAIEMTGKTTLPPILRYDYFHNVILPRALLAAALTVIANAILFASIVIG